MLQVFQQRGDRLTVNFHRLLQRTSLHGQTHDTTVIVIAIGVTNIMLHVADDYVAPVRHVQSPVCTDDRIRRPEIAIATVDQVFNRSSPDLAEFPFLAGAISSAGNFDVDSSDDILAVEEFDPAVVEAVLESLAIPYFELGDLHGGREVAFHPRVLLG